ncbi:MAG: glucose-1-phosphate adenylyltransferase [Planctomycetes bacterium]|nr:glucose-1-phosphate adenylyltransferase [Planctomycetota bacterium]MCC7062967.1 glucose-1-phosphate adenylyltransferase [Planctomycetota bacterium]
MVSLDLKNTVVFLLAGGEGSRLKPLTQNRAKPAVPFGGCYRIIDFALSNCIHSGLRRINLLTQYQARSLEEHIRFGWNFLPRRLEQWITCTPPHHVTVGKWYRGTADAIFHNLDTIDDWKPPNVLVLSGDHIYQMDYRDMLREHVEHQAALTIGAVRIPIAQANRFGILQIAADGRVTGFVEKPKTNAPEIPGDPGFCLASMGIYVFETQELVRRLKADNAMPEGQGGDFGHHVIPRMIDQVPVYAHFFRGIEGETSPYWRDVGTIEALFDANMDLCAVKPQLNLYNKDWPTYTLWHNDPPAKTVFSEVGDGRRAEVQDSLLCPGVVVSGGKVRRSVLSNRVYVDEHSELDECIVMRGARIGKRCKLRRTIVDKWNVIPDGTVIGYDAVADRKRFTVSESGIVVVEHGHAWD